MKWAWLLVVLLPGGGLVALLALAWMRYVRSRYEPGEIIACPPHEWRRGNGLICTKCGTYPGDPGPPDVERGIYG